MRRCEGKGKYLGMPYLIGRSKKMNLSIYQGQSEQEGIRVEGEISIASWQRTSD